MFKGQLVKNLIESKGITQIEAAKMAGLSKGTLNSMLSESGNPRAENIQALAKALRCSIDEFFDWEPDFIPVSTVNRAGEEMPKYGLSAIKRENIHLHQLIEEKERLIKVLEKNQKSEKNESKE